MYESGTMVKFYQMFPDIGKKATRVLTTFNDPKLGSDTYGFIEVYCVDPDCDCRRVILNVVRQSDSKHLATVNWAFDKDAEDPRPFLDRLNVQSELSDALLKMVGVTLENKEYVQRLERHYRMVKEAVAVPDHEIHQILKGMPWKGEGENKKALYVGALTDAELGKAWLKVGLDVPRELVDETLRRGEKMIPHLGALLVDEDLWAEPPNSKEGWAPAHALMLLSAIGGANVTPYAVKFLRRGLGEDWLTQEGDGLVYSLGANCVDVIWELAEDEKADMWGRSVAISGLCTLGLAHESLRPDLVARSRSLTDAIMAKPKRLVMMADSAVLDSLVDSLACMHDEPSRALIKRVFRDDRFSLDSQNKLGTLALFDQPFEQLLADMQHDPLDHFKPEELNRLKEVPAPKDDEDAEELTPQPYVGKAKVGRNDPCPCGSGKKYKKCCLSS